MINLFSLIFKNKKGEATINNMVIGVLIFSAVMNFFLFYANVDYYSNAEFMTLTYDDLECAQFENATTCEDYGGICKYTGCDNWDWEMDIDIDLSATCGFGKYCCMDTPLKKCLTNLNNTFSDLSDSDDMSLWKVSKKTISTWDIIYKSLTFGGWTKIENPMFRFIMTFLFQIIPLLVILGSFGDWARGK